MNILNFTVFLTGLFIVTITLSSDALAQCNVTGMTPDGGEVVVCSGTDTNGIETTDLADEVTVNDNADLSNPGGDVIETLNGDDYVEINGGMITGPSTDDFNCVDFGLGNNELLMTAGTLICGEGIVCAQESVCKITIEGGTIDATTTLNDGGEVIFTTNNDDEIYVSGGVLTATDGVIQTDDGDDIIIITGGTFKQTDSSDEVIDCSDGDDLISISNALIDGSMNFPEDAIDADDQDDTVKLGTGAEIIGLIDGNRGFDTLVFEMEVPEEAVDFFCSQIFAQDPREGSVTVNGLFYEWDDFELLVCDLQPANNIRPIPTLSKWSLLAMAGVLGIVGLLAIRRRMVTG